MSDSDQEKKDQLSKARRENPENNKLVFPENFGREFGSGNRTQAISKLGKEGLQKASEHLPEAMKKKLEDVRQKYQASKKLAGEGKTLLKSATPWGFFSLMGEFNFISDWAYGLALGAAILKDLLDLTFVGSLPGIGTVITLCTSIFIGFMMILGNILHVEHDRTIIQSYLLKKFIVRWIVLLATTIFEMLFGLNFIPIQTAGVFIIYSFALAARKNRRDAEKKEREVEEDELSMAA